MDMLIWLREEFLVVGRSKLVVHGRSRCSGLCRQLCLSKGHMARELQKYGSTHYGHLREGVLSLSGSPKPSYGPFGALFSSTTSGSMCLSSSIQALTKQSCSKHSRTLRLQYGWCGWTGKPERGWRRVNQEESSNYLYDTVYTWDQHPARIMIQSEGIWRYGLLFILGIDMSCGKCITGDHFWFDFVKWKVSDFMTTHIRPVCHLTTFSHLVHKQE